MSLPGLPEPAARFCRAPGVPTIVNRAVVTRTAIAVPVPRETLLRGLMSTSRPFRIAALLVTLAASTLAFSADGKTLLEQGHFRQLSALAQDRLKHNPNDGEALSWMSAVYDAYGNFERSVELGRRAVEAAPNSAEIHCQLADSLGDRALQLGVLGGGVPLARQMRHELDISLQLEPRSVRCLKESMGLYEESPAIVGGSKSKARETLQRIYQISPADGALAEAALLQMQKRPLPEIESYLRKAVQLNPRLYRAVIDLTSILDSDGYRRYAEAEHFARIGIAADPNRAGCYSYLAAALAHQQHWNDLDAALAEAQRRVPDNPAPLYFAALALLESGTDLPRAERYLRQYIAREPEAGAPTQSTAHWKLGLVLEKEGRRTDAANELRAAAAQNGNDPAFKKDLKRIAG
jgi:tetratricopeptide (TPR) repeat protein